MSKMIEQPKQAAAMQAITVQVGGQSFALDILSVREIRGWLPPTPLPHAPPYLKGMIDLRGSLIPVVALADRLGLPEAEANSSSVIAVTATRGGIVGMVVESVSDIITVTESMIQPPPHIGGNPGQSMIRGMLLMDGRIIGIVSMDDIIPADLISAELLAA